MVENRNGKKVLITPVTAEDLADIHIGDIVYLDGDLVTCRDVAHRRLIEGKRELPVDLHGKAILHAGPIVRPSRPPRPAMKWFPSARRPRCVWKSSRRNLLSRPA